MMVWAPSGVGKTMLTLTVALAVAGGGAVFGWTAPEPRKVLLVDGEMNIVDLQERLRSLAGTVTGFDAVAAGKNLTVVARQYQDPDAAFPDLATPEGRECVFKLIRETGADLVVLDNLSTLATLEDENDAAKMSPALAFLMRLKQAGVGCILVHHSGKAGTSFRGSSKLATTFEVILGLKSSPTVPGSFGTAMDLEWTKFRGKRSEAVEGRRVHLDEAGGVLSWHWKLSEHEEARQLVALVKTGEYRTQAQLATKLAMSTGKLSGLKHDAFGAGLITPEEWEEYLRAGEDASPF